MASNGNHLRVPMIQQYEYVQGATLEISMPCIYRSSWLTTNPVGSRQSLEAVSKLSLVGSSIEMFVKLVLTGILFFLRQSVVGALNIPIPGLDHDRINAISGMAVKILSESYADMKEVVIHADSTPLAIKFLRESESLSTIIYNDGSLVDNPVKLRLYHNSFVMTPRSVSALGKMLLSFKKSLRWNVMAPFIILDNSNRECKNARQMLKLTWTMNLVKSYFLCVDSKSKSMVYTSNPYTNRAPQEWQQVSKSARESHGWTMYRRQYDERNICQGFDFERTKYLDGSVIKLAIDLRKPGTLVPHNNYNKSIYAQMWPEDIYLIERMEYCLNVTPIFNVGQRQDLFDYVEKGTCDVLLKYMLFENAHDTHPVYYSDYYIVTNNRGFYTPLEKIGNFFGMVTLISLCVILPITFIVILLSANTRRWSFSGFEILRLLINAALHTRMDTIALRIFFSMIFLYFLILHAMFQGHIVRFLMKQEYRKNAETLNDLRDSRYQSIHVHWTVEEHITDPILRQKLIPGEPDCTHEIIGNESVACIATSNNFIDSAFEYKLHVSKNPVLRFTNHHRIRSDWPLEERFNKFLMLLEGSGQSSDDWKRRHYGKILETQKREKAKEAPPEIRPISFSMLDWVFATLLIGLKLAAMSLTFERRTRSQAMLRRQNRRAARRNIVRRRRELLNKIMSDLDVAAGSRPRTI